MRIFVGLLVVSILIAFYFISWRLNKNTALPNGGISGGSCDSCDSAGCGFHPSQKG